jgi:hypothetical protein
VIFFFFPQEMSKTSSHLSQTVDSLELIQASIVREGERLQRLMDEQFALIGREIQQKQNQMREYLQVEITQRNALVQSRHEQVMSINGDQ